MVELLLWWRRDVTGGAFQTNTNLANHRHRTKLLADCQWRCRWRCGLGRFRNTRSFCSQSAHTPAYHVCWGMQLLMPPLGNLLTLKFLTFRTSFSVLHRLPTLSISRAGEVITKTIPRDRRKLVKLMLRKCTFLPPPSHLISQFVKRHLVTIQREQHALAQWLRQYFCQDHGVRCVVYSLLCWLCSSSCACYHLPLTYTVYTWTLLDVMREQISNGTCAKKDCQVLCRVTQIVKVEYFPETHHTLQTGASIYFKACRAWQNAMLGRAGRWPSCTQRNSARRLQAHSLNTDSRKLAQSCSEMTNQSLTVWHWFTTCIPPTDVVTASGYLFLLSLSWQTRNECAWLKLYCRPIIYNL